MLKRSWGVIAGVGYGRAGAPTYEYVIEKTAPIKNITEREFGWITSGEHNLYVFYKRAYVEPTLKSTPLNNPALYEDVDGHFEEYLRGLFYDWIQLRDVIVANLPQPIAEEVMFEIEWKRKYEYIKIVRRGNKEVLKSCGLRKCPRA